MVDITIGQYYPEDSVIHKLDPRVKLFGTLVFVVMVFMINNVICLLYTSDAADEL